MNHFLSTCRQNTKAPFTKTIINGHWNFELSILNLFQVAFANTLLLKLNKSNIFIDEFKRTGKWSYIVIAIVFGLFISIISLLQYYQFTSAVQFKWNDFINSDGIMIACIVIVIEANSKKANFMHLIRVKCRIERELRKMCGSRLYDAKKMDFLEKYWKLFVRFQVVVGLLEIFIILAVYNFQLWILYCIAHAIPITYLRLRFFQHYFHVLSVQFYLQLIYEHVERYIHAFDHLEEMVELRNSSFIEFDTRTMIYELDLIKDLYNVINEMANLVNGLFNFSMLSILIVNFLLFSTNLLWMCVVLSDQNLYSTIGEFFLGDFNSTLIIVGKKLNYCVKLLKLT